jgi:ketosteroid isomerase-like protein
VAVPIGTLAVGGQLRARFAMFLEIREGRIARQRNYDCFYPF